MNRLIILGNGFDLAHGLKTRYEDFAFHHVKEAAKFFVVSSYPGSSLITIIKGQKPLRVNILADVNSIDQFVHLFRQDMINFSCDNKLFKELLLNRSKEYRWVDVEMMYYHMLKVTVLQPTYFKDGRVTHMGVQYLQGLNRDFEEIKQEFVSYLKSQVIPESDRVVVKEFLNIFSQNLLEHHNDHQPQETCFLNFNYTPTAQNYFDLVSGVYGYLSEKEISIWNDISINNIHGVLNHSDDHIIFGFGDEIDQTYKKIENANENRLFDYIKSFGYFRSSNYKDLQKFIASAPFEVFIVGHSCGLSDRTLLNEIFESNTCKAIKIFHHENEQNYITTTHEISRHFRDKKMMRSRIIPFDSKSFCPQIEKSGQTIRFGKNSITSKDP